MHKNNFNAKPKSNLRNFKTKDLEVDNPTLDAPTDLLPPLILYIYIYKLYTVLLHLFHHHYSQLIVFFIKI